MRKPKLPPAPPPPAYTPTRADATAGMLGTGQQARPALNLVRTGQQGLLSRAQTTKRSLIGGA